MSQYLGYFLGGGGQIVALGAALVVWLGLCGLGGLVPGGGAGDAGRPIHGWGVAVLLFTLGGVFTPFSFTHLALLGVLLAAVGAYVGYRRDGRLLPAGSGRLALLVLPVLLLVSAMQPSQWDEFSHWLPSVRFLLDADVFPDAARPVTGASFPAYPYGWPLLSYLAGRVAGGMVANAGALLNLFLLLNLGLALTDAMGRALGKDPVRGWAWAALAGLVVTAFNPSFVQKLVLTAYSDASSAVLAGFGIILAWRLLEAAAEDRRPAAWRLAVQLGLVLAVLVNLRQANLVLAVLIATGIGVVALRDPAVRIRDWVGHLAAAVAPFLVTYLAWRYHVATELAGREFAIRPTHLWNLDVLPEIMLAMARVASKKGVYFLLMAGVLGFAARALFRFSSSLDRLALLAAILFLGYNAFLLFTYVAAFERGNALAATSFWRYNTHAALGGLAFAAFGAALLWRRFSPGPVWARVLKGGAVVLLLAMPLVFAKKLRFDLEAPKPHYQAVAKMLPSLIGADGTFFLMDPKGSGEAQVITRYHLGRPSLRHFSARARPSPAEVARFVAEVRPGAFLLVHSSAPGLAQALGREVADDGATLLRRENEGWREIRRWPVSE